MPSSLEITPRSLELLRAEFRSIIDLIDACGLTDPAPGAPECATSATAGMTEFAPAIRAAGAASMCAASAAHSNEGGPQ